MRLPLLVVGVAAAACVMAQSNSQSSFEWEYMPVVQGLGLAYTPDGKTIAVGGVGGIQLINTATRAQRSLPATPNSDFNAVAISPDGKSLVLGGNDVEVWNVAAGKLTGMLTFPGAMVNSVAYSPNGRWLAVSGFSITFHGPYQPPTSSSIVQIYDASSFAPVTGPLYSNGGAANSVVFSKDSQHLIEGGSASATTAMPGYVDVWNALTGAFQGTLATRATAGVSSVALSSDGTQVAVAGSDSTGAILEVWKWQQASLAQSIPVSSSSQLKSVAWSPDQKLLAVSGNQPTGSGNNDTVAIVQTWNLASGKLAHNFNVSASLNAQAVVFSPDGRTIANCQGSSLSSIARSPGGYLQLWNSSSNALESSIDTIGSYGSAAVAFAPNGRVVAQPWTSLTGNTIRLLNSTDGELIRSLHSQITTALGPVAYSQKGGYLADAGILTTKVGSSQRSTGLIEVWSALTSQSLFSLRSSANVSISSIGFSNDGTKLALGGMDAAGGVVELWSVAHRRLIADLKTRATGAVSCVAVSPDGKYVADGGHDFEWNGTLEIWDGSSGKAIATLATACTSTVQFLSFSPDGKVLAVAGYPASSSGFVVEFWNTKDWNRAMTYATNGAINGIAFTPDSKTLLFNWGYSLQALSVEYGVVFVGYPDAGFGSVAVSSSSDRIVTTSANGQVLAMRDSVSSVVWATGVSVNPGSFTGGSTATGTLKLSAPAPAGGLTVQLFVNISGATVMCPSTVVVPAGKTVASFTISSSPVTSPVTALLGVESNGSFATARCTFTVTP
ncbi:MAG: WD40 repeat domain-containing protein [Fimbriimonas sp.]|nr:WD40 repeat domain-containing protein [Fimbriimonas sp.]